MSQRIITQPIPFQGTDEQARVNRATHHFGADEDGRCYDCDCKPWHKAADRAAMPFRERPSSTTTRRISMSGYRSWTEMKAEGIEVETMSDYVNEVRGFNDYDPPEYDDYHDGMADAMHEAALEAEAEYEYYGVPYKERGDAVNNAITLSSDIGMYEQVIAEQS